MSGIQMVDAVGTSKMVNAPSALIISFDRATASGKSDRLVDYPERLPLASHMDSEAVPSEYQLQAVISHIGTSTSSGHYTAKARGTDGKWRLFNDADVKEIEGPLEDNEAYILFYSLVSDLAIHRRRAD